VQGRIGDVAKSLHTSSSLAELKLLGNRIGGDFGDGGADVLCGMARRSLTALDLSQNAIQGSVPACLLDSGVLCQNGEGQAALFALRSCYRSICCCAQSC